MGTAELACASLEVLTNFSAFEVLAVVTQPDKRKGRDLKLQASPVKRLALERNLRVLQPLRARDELFLQELRGLKPDLIVVAAYGQILPQTILDLPQFGCLNVHTSLLPKFRGAAPIQRAILEGELETGVTIMKMDAGLDTGDILTQRKTEIRDEVNAETLHERLAKMGAELLLPTILDYSSGKIVPQKQPNEGSSYAPKITKEDGRIDWQKPARKIWNQVRAFTPWPGAFTFQSVEAKTRLLKIWQASIVENSSGAPGEILQADKNGIVVACVENSLRILVLQREGGRQLTAQEFCAGGQIKVKDLLR